MKLYTAAIHWFVRRLRLESYFIWLGRRWRLAQKLVPQPSAYPPNDRIRIERDGVHYEIDRSDYMQWVLYADLEDPSWSCAIDRLGPDCVVFDVGANCGQFCLKVAHALTERKQPSSVYAFEPNPLVFSKLQSNLRLNPTLEPTVRLVNIALGDSKGSSLFAYSQGNSGGGTLRSVEVTGAESFCVTVETLDQIFSRLDLKRLDFLKIDVEGHEPAVFRGGESTIRRYLPVIYFECTPKWYLLQGEPVDGILQQLQNWGYRLQADLGNGWSAIGIEPARDWSEHAQFNVLAIPN